MTVSTSAAKAGPYTGNDVTSSFAFSFKVFADDDLRVVETVIATEAESDLVLNTNYTVTRNVDQDSNPGGTITYKVASVTTALPSTKKLTIVGDFDFEQPTDIPNGGGFFANVIERALDRVTLLVKQLKVDSDRSVKVDVSSSIDPDDLIDDLTDASAASVAAAAAAAASEAAAASSESAAAISAAAAQAAASAVMWSDVSFKAFADSPITIGVSDYGKLFAIDTTNGNVVVNLPQISGLDLGIPWVVGIKKTDATANTITINRAGSDTIDGATSKTISSADAGTVLIPDTDTAPDEWTGADFGASTGQTKKQQFSGGGVDFTAGSTTTLTITETPIPSTKDAIAIYFDAAYQQEDTWSYVASTGVITFTSAIPVGTSKVETVWDTPLGVGTPADGTVTTAKIADVNVTTAKIADLNVTTAKIADVNVTTAKIADSNVTAAKLSGAQSGSAPVFGARAWVKFNGTGTVAINASGNVSSVTDNGTGDYTVNFTTAMPDADYAAVVTAVSVAVGGAFASTAGYASTDSSTPTTYTSSALRISIKRSDSAAYADVAAVSVVVFR